MFEFLKNQYVLGKITAERVYSYSPRYITPEEANEIVNTPQTGTLSQQAE